MCTKLFLSKCNLTKRTKYNFGKEHKYSYHSWLKTLWRLLEKSMDGLKKSNKRKQKEDDGDQVSDRDDPEVLSNATAKPYACTVASKTVKYLVY